MSKQKRFETRKSIVDKIDDYLHKHEEALTSAEKMDRELDELAKEPTMVETVKLRRLDVKRLRRRAFLIETKKLPQLKHTLAAFDTELLPGVTDDPAVVMEKV